MLPFDVKMSLKHPPKERASKIRRRESIVFRLDYV